MRSGLSLLCLSVRLSVRSGLSLLCLSVRLFVWSGLSLLCLSVRLSVRSGLSLRCLSVRLSVWSGPSLLCLCLSGRRHSAGCCHCLAYGLRLLVVSSSTDNAMGAATAVAATARRTFAARSVLPYARRAPARAAGNNVTLPC